MLQAACNTHYPIKRTSLSSGLWKEPVIIWETVRTPGSPFVIYVIGSSPLHLVVGFWALPRIWYWWRSRLSKGCSIFLKYERWLIFPTEKRTMAFLCYLSPLFDFATSINFASEPFFVRLLPEPPSPVVRTRAKHPIGPRRSATGCSRTSCGATATRCLPVRRSAACSVFLTSGWRRSMWTTSGKRCPAPRGPTLKELAVVFPTQKSRCPIGRA